MIGDGAYDLGNFTVTATSTSAGASTYTVTGAPTWFYHADGNNILQANVTLTFITTGDTISPSFRGEATITDLSGSFAFVSALGAVGDTVSFGLHRNQWL